MAGRPLFINTKGQRGRDTGFEIDDLEGRYLRAFCGRFEYDGLPEGCPPDYIERMMYCLGGVSGKKVRGLGPVIMGAAPSTFSTYGYPVHWTPSLAMGDLTSSGPLADSIMEQSDMPMLYDREPVREMVQPYLEIMRKAMNALNMNLVGLGNPVLVQAPPGLELKGKIIKNNLGNGDIYIPVVDQGTVPASILDMKATDHTANLLGVIHDADGEILDIMGIRSSLEKASGISTAEASASEMQISQNMKMELRRREQWLEKLNAKLGTNITVRLGEGWEYAAADADPEDEDADNKPGDGAA